MSAPRAGTAATDREIADRFAALPRTVVTTHVNPDGDALGSALAFVHAYRDLGGEAEYVQIGSVASLFRFLPGFDAIRRAPDGLDPAPEILLAVDCASADRIERILERTPPTTAILNVDHHETNTRFGDLNLVDVHAAATGEIVHRLLRTMGAPLSRETAICLYAAIVTDTGRFGYPATRPETHLVAAELLRAGIRPEEIHEPLYRSYPLGFLRLTAELTRRMGTRLGGRIAWVELTHAMCEVAGLIMEDAADMVDIPASVEGVEVAALFRETERPGMTKVSLRSKRGCAVNRIAERHGGGGHPAAAGFTFAAGIPESRDRILAEVEEAMRDGR